MRSTSGAKGKPSYDESLSAYQAAFRPDLKEIVDSLAISKDMRLLDVPCGNGFYSRFLSDRLGPLGKLDCVDLCPEYLIRTRKKLRKANCRWEAERADIYQLPFDDNTFDLIWCAQSLISIKDPASALQEMKRVLRPGGTLAVLENDIIHHVLLPWPVDLEVPIQSAIRTGAREQFGSSAKLAPVRRLPELFEKVGLRDCQKRTFAADRQAPWLDSVRSYLEFHVKDVLTLVRDHVSPKTRNAFRRFANPKNANSLFGAKAMDLTCLNVLYQARKPGHSPG